MNVHSLALSETLLPFLFPLFAKQAVYVIDTAYIFIKTSLLLSYLTDSHFSRYQFAQKLIPYAFLFERISFKLSVYGSLAIPYSVTIPLIKSWSVTSNAGLYTLTPSGAIRS